MSIVPEYNESVQTDGPQQESLAITPRGAESSGENIAASAGSIGKEAEAFGMQMTRQLLYQKRQKDMIEGNNRYAEFVGKYLQAPSDPLLARRGAQAIGITHGSAVDPDQQARDMAMGVSSLSEDARAKLDPSFIKTDDSWVGIKARALDFLKNGADGKSPLPPEVARSILQRGERASESFEGSFAKHEAEQTQIAHVDSLNNSFQATVQAASMARNVDEFQSLVPHAQDALMQVSRIQGHPIDEAVTKTAINQKAAAESTDQFIRANLEKDPELTQKILTSMKPLIHAADYGKFQGMIEGKMMDVREAHSWDNNIVPDKGNYDSEGQFNLGAVDKNTRALFAGRPDHEINHAVAQAHSRAVTANSEMKQSFDDHEKTYLDGFVAAKAANPDANFVDVKKDMDAKMVAADPNFPKNRLAKAGESAMQTWLKSPDGQGRRLELIKNNTNLDEGYQNSLNQIDENYTGTSPRTKEQKRLAIQNLNNEVTSVDKQGNARYTKGDQIAAWQAERFKSIKVPGVVWGTNTALKGEEQTAALQALGGNRDKLDAAWEALKTQLHRAPTWADMHGYINHLKNKPTETDPNVIP